MMTSGVPLDPDGQPIRNEPGSVVVRVYRVDPDGQRLHDIGGACILPHLVDRVADIQAALGGIVGSEVVKAIMREVYGHDGTRPPVPAAPVADPMADFLKELGDAHDHDATT